MHGLQKLDLTRAGIAGVVRWLSCAFLVCAVSLRTWTQTTQPDPLLTLMLSQPSIPLSAPVRVGLEVDPPVVNVGELSILRYTVLALQDSVEWPEKIPAAAALNARQGGSGQILNTVGTNVEARTTFIYRLRPAEPGQFTIPQFEVKAYGRPVQMPAAVLQVLPKGVGKPQAPQSLRLDVSSTNAFVGQSVRVKILLPLTSPGGQSLSQVQLTGLSGQGFLADQTSVRQRIEPVPYRGTNQITYIYETILTPISAGSLSFYAEGWSTINRTTGPVYITNNTIMNLVVTHLFMDSDPVDLVVRPLPRAGALPGFVGAVGQFTNDLPVLSTNIVRAGDPIRMKVTFRGDGNIARLVPPPAPQSDEWQIFEASGDPTAPQMLHAQGAITFTYTLIPLTPAAKRTPALPYSYFDPVAQKYVDLTIPSVPLRIIPADSTIDTAAFAPMAPQRGEAARVLSLSNLAPAPGAAASLTPLQNRLWFPLVQITPAVLFLGLWAWDKRRRYWRQHPDVLLRVRGLRALRRERKTMDRAIAAGNPVAFAEAAVRALRAGSSPHYPAQPSALVGSDILEVLPPCARNAAPGQAVRLLFSITDAASFSEDSPGVDRLVDLKDPLLSALDMLEAELRRPSPNTNITPPSAATVSVLLCIAALLGLCERASAQTNVSELWAQGTNAYALCDYETAARCFGSMALVQPAAGTLQNLGNAEWQLGHAGKAILAWEQALWLNPFNRAASQNLAFARKTVQLDAPDLTWYEATSTWLPVNLWPWITGTCLWISVGMVLLPGIFGERKESWHQAVAAVGFTLFLLCIPAQIGVHTRTRLGFILEKDTALRLTPTREAQTVLHLAAGEPARLKRERGPYVLVRAGRAQGWILRSELGLISSLQPLPIPAKPTETPATASH